MKFQTNSVSTRLAKAKSAKARSREMAIVPDVDGSSCSRRHTAADRAAFDFPVTHVRTHVRVSVRTRSISADAPVSVRNPSDDSMPASTELNGNVPTSST